jgi:hypothetical protein
MSKMADCLTWARKGRMPRTLPDFHEHTRIIRAAVLPLTVPVPRPILCAQVLLLPGVGRGGSGVRGGSIDPFPRPAPIRRPHGN